MPQELNVLRCYACKTFQVQIVKKIPKWQCKICNEKQSILKVYAKGNGKDCRQYVQTLNMQQGFLQSIEPDPETVGDEVESTTFSECQRTSDQECHNSQRSKWHKYVVDDSEEKINVSSVNYKVEKLERQISNSFEEDNPMSGQSFSKWNKFLRNDCGERELKEKTGYRDNSAPKGLKRKLDNCEDLSLEETVCYNEAPALDLSSNLCMSERLVDQFAQNSSKNLKSFNRVHSVMKATTFVPVTKNMGPHKTHYNSLSKESSNKGMEEIHSVGATLKVEECNSSDISRVSLITSKLPETKSDKNNVLCGKRLGFAVETKHPFFISDDDELDNILDL